MEKVGGSNIIIKLKKGDEKAFRILFDKFFPSLCLFAERFVVNRLISEDIVLEAFMKYWKKHADFDNINKIKSYLYLIVRNQCLNHCRDQKDNLKVEEFHKVESLQFYSDSVIEEEAYRIFYNAVENLPSQMKNVILYSLEGLKNREIAHSMGITENTVHSYKKEAYKRLKTALKDHYFLYEMLLLFLL
jgi:RNA polymerase sigma-70 factor (family 1)